MNKKHNNIEAFALTDTLHQFGVHPFADLFPCMDMVSLKKLSEDIKKNGQQEPIKTIGNKIIDGRNRYMSCLLLNIPQEIREICVENPLEYVIESNLHRHNLNGTQRALIGASLTIDHNISTQRTCQLVKVGKSSLCNAIEVRSSGIQKLIDMASAGKLSLSFAKEVSCLSDQEQKRVLIYPKKDMKHALNSVQGITKEETPERLVEVIVRFTEKEIQQIDATSRQLAIGGRASFIHEATTQCSVDWIRPTEEELQEFFGYGKTMHLRKRYTKKMRTPDESGSSQMERDYEAEEENFIKEHPYQTFEGFLKHNKKHKNY